MEKRLILAVVLMIATVFIVNVMFPPPPPPERPVVVEDSVTVPEDVADAVAETLAPGRPPVAAEQVEEELPGLTAADQPEVERAPLPGRGFAVARQGEGDRGADDEEEGREDLIGRREAVPFGVAQGGVDVAPASRVVDQDHAGDGEAPEAVEGREAHDSDSAAVDFPLSAKSAVAASASLTAGLSGL